MNRLCAKENGLKKHFLKQHNRYRTLQKECAVFFCAKTMSSHRARTAGRLEAFSDGVIAIILTIMVLELHVPHEDGFHGLLSVMPRLGIYLLSFVLIGIYWINHHELMRRVETITYRILWANLVWLFALSLVPYFTDYVGEMHYSGFSTALYAGIMMVAGLTFGILRLTILAQQRKQGELQHADRTEMVKHMISLVLYIAAIFVAFRYVWCSFLLNLAVTFVWIAPELGTNECHDPQ